MAKKKSEAVIEPVEIVDTPEVDDIAPARIVATVLADKLNVREEASTNSNVVRVVNKGDKIELVSPIVNSGFYEINDGYVMAKFVTF